MTFIPSTPRTEEERAETLRRLLDGQTAQKTESIVQSGFSITELSDRYVFQDIIINNKRKKVHVTKEMLDNSQRYTLKTWQTKPGIRTIDDLTEWDIPTLPNFTQLIISIYNHREHINEQEQNIIESFSDLLKIDSLMSCTCYDTIQEQITQYRYKNEQHIPINGFDIDKRKELLIGADFDLFQKAAIWLTGESPIFGSEFEIINETKREHIISYGRYPSDAITIQNWCDPKLCALGIKIEECK